MTALVLGLLALVLCGPGPSLLGRIDALRSVPRAAMLLWQSTTLAAVLAGVGAIAAVATDNALAPSPSIGRRVAFGLAVLLSLVVIGRLLWTGHRVGTRLRSLRRRHRDLLDALSSEDTVRGDDMSSARGRAVKVLHHESPMAYCIPGWNSRVVLSDGIVASLDRQEIQAVLAHEQAHLNARHDLVLEAFTVLYEAFPRWVSSRYALSEVRLLVELLADRAAARKVGAGPLARALICLASTRVPVAGLGAGGSSVALRVSLLADRSTHRLLALATTTAAVLVLALPTFFVALPWLHEVWASL